MARPKEGYHDLFAQIPDALWEALCDDAAVNDRSATAQLIQGLKKLYPEAAKKAAVERQKARANGRQKATKE
jgi:hypothetical protein